MRRKRTTKSGTRTERQSGPGDFGAAVQQVDSDFAKVDKDFDNDTHGCWPRWKKSKETQRFVEMTAQAVHDSRETYHRLASDFDEAEGSFERGAGMLTQADEEMTTATIAMLVGTGDRGENGQDYAKKAFALPNKVLTEEDRDGQHVIVTVGSPWKSWRSHGEGLRGFESLRRSLRKSSTVLTSMRRSLWR